MRRTATWWSYWAVCQECDFTVSGKNGLGLAAQHHDRTGHTVVTDVEGSIRYGAPVEVPSYPEKGPGRGSP